MATKGYSFQDDEEIIIDIDMDIVVEKQKKDLEWMRKLYLHVFWKIWNLKFG